MTDYIDAASNADATAFMRRAFKALRLREEARPGRIANGLAPGVPLDLFNDGHREVITTGAVEFTRVSGEAGGYVQVGPAIDAMQGLDDGEGGTFTFAKLSKSQLRKAFQDDIDARALTVD